MSRKDRPTSKRRTTRPLGAADLRWPPAGWITTQEAARRLKLCVPQVVRYLQTGRLQGKLFPGGWIVREDAVASFVPTPVGNPNWRRKADARRRKELSGKG